MPKGVKKNTTEVPETTTTVAPVVEVKVKKTKAPKEVSVASTVVETVVAAPSVVAPVSEDNVVISSDEVDVSLTSKSSDFLAKLNQWCSMGAALKTEFRTLERLWSRELKTAQKNSSKRKRKGGVRTPSGFVKPTRISTELSKFLNKTDGTEMARTDVTREINAYIRLHNLQDKENGRKILPDAKLSTLLKIKPTDELTYFNLQKYLSPHFFKTVKSDAPAATTSSV
jgi:chromatin remodeling complex protein RSC6